MVRSFTEEPIEQGLLSEVLTISIRAATAGNSKGISFLALDDKVKVEEFWNISLPDIGNNRKDFTWPDLLKAPVLVLILADPDIYISRYQEQDKQKKSNKDEQEIGGEKADNKNKTDNNKIGRDPKKWDVPYWFVDAGFAVQNLLLAVNALGLGALFFGIFKNQDELRANFKIPSSVYLVGAVALGHINKEKDRPSKSLKRKTPIVNQRIHFNSYSIT